jgi:hypothetical protein
MSTLALLSLMLQAKSTTPKYLTWDYPPLQLPVANLVFDIYHTSNPALGLAGFTLWKTVTAPPVAIPPGQSAEFFICRARDLETGLVSDWNTK